MAASNYVEKETLKLWLVGATAPAAPTKAWLALCEAKVVKTENGKEISEAGKAEELTYGGYVRKEIKLEAATWEETAGSGEAVATKLVNKSAIEMAVNTKTEGRENAKFFAICEKEKASETGNVFFFGKITTELKITTSLTKVEFKAKELEVSAE